MKLRLKKKKSGRGRKMKIGGRRMHFFPGLKLMALLAEIKKQARDILKLRLSYSYFFRVGARKEALRLRQKIDRALKGRYHAKLR